MDASLRKNKAVLPGAIVPTKHRTNNNGKRQQKPVQPIVQLDSKEKAKLGKSMKRRMSVHYTEMPGMPAPGDVGSGAPALPQGILDQYRQSNDDMPSKDVIGSTRMDHSGTFGQSVSSMSTNRVDLLDPKVMKMLGDSGFNAEQFISSRLNDATASDIDKFSSNLTSLHNKISQDIKYNSTKTYEMLMNSSKELNTTNEELKILRNCINELSELSSQLKETAEQKIQMELEQQDTITKTNSFKAKKSKAQRAQDRSSLMVLEKMWNNEMNSLFKHVEGAQKFISSIPGRHILTESGCWYELNSATYKLLQPIHFFILNDLILVATKKRKTTMKKGNMNQYLIAEQCWPIREVSITELDVQTNESNNKTMYGINITCNSLSYIYQTDRLDHYQRILSNFKKAQDELKEISEVENLKQRQLRDSINLLSISEKRKSSSQGHMRSASGSQTPKRLSHPQKGTGNGSGSSNGNGHQSSKADRNSQLIMDLSTRMHTRSRSLDESNCLKKLNRLDNEVDEIDVLIFHENFNEAILRLTDIENELNKMEGKLEIEEEIMFESLISYKITTKRTELESNLMKYFKLHKTGNLSITKNEFINAIKSVKMLNGEDISQNFYLNYCSNYMKSLIDNTEKETNIDGKLMIIDYILEISFIKFYNLKNIIEQFQRLFGSQDHSHDSILVSWCYKEVTQLISLLQKIIKGERFSLDDMNECIFKLHKQVVYLKQHVGIDVEYLMEGFYETIETTNK